MPILTLSLISLIKPLAIQSISPHEKVIQQVAIHYICVTISVMHIHACIDKLLNK